MHGIHYVLARVWKRHFVLKIAKERGGREKMFFCNWSRLSWESTPLHLPLVQFQILCLSRSFKQGQNNSKELCTLQFEHHIGFSLFCYIFSILVYTSAMASDNPITWKVLLTVRLAAVLQGASFFSLWRPFCLLMYFLRLLAWSQFKIYRWWKCFRSYQDSNLPF